MTYVGSTFRWTSRPRSLRDRLVAGVIAWAFGTIALVAVGVASFPRNADWAWRLHFAFPIFSGLVFIVAGVVIVRRGLSPFVTMRERLAAVRDGRTPRLEGEYPLEVGPLVDDLNTLLEERERRVARAIARAGDLAHGLKTPLAILAQDIEHAETAGQPELAASIRRQVDRMRRQIDWHLAQARVTAAGAATGARADVVEAARGLARTMERLHASRALAIAVDVPAGSLVRVPIEDLEEMLGNLLDNACKWAKSRVLLGASDDGSYIAMTIDDDGPGLHPSMRHQVLRRGVRADEAAPGSGLGLAIVRDLADAYGGAIVLEQSELGGLRARLTLPAQR